MAGAGDCAPYQKSAQREGLLAVPTTITTTLHSTTLPIQLQLLQLRLHYNTLQYTSLHYTNNKTPQLKLHYTTTATTAALHQATSGRCG